MSALISFGIYLASSGIIILPIDVIVSDVVIDWGDGNTSSPISYINPLHNYDTPGSYTIKILSGSFTAINTNETNPLFQSSLTSFSYYTQIPELINFNYAFYNVTSNFTLYFAPNVTNNVTSAIRMFYNAITFNNSLSNLNTSAVMNMSGIFRNARSFNKSISNFNTSNVTNMSGMFIDAISFNQPLSNFNTSNVTTMINMFRGASAFNQPLSSFNTSAVHRMTSMFENATVFNQSLSHFNISNLSIASDMLTNSGLSSSNYNNLLISWASQAPNIQSNVPFNAYPIQYTSLSAQSARNKLTNAPYNWFIIDGGANISTTPTILSITPSIGSVSGGTYVTIKGTNFIIGNTSVTFGGISASLFIITSTQLTVITPANNAGSVNVVVNTNAGSAIRNNGFTYDPIPCFLKGTNILTNKGYVPIENLKKGDLVQTFKNGFVPIVLIGNKEINNNDIIDSPLYKLYKYPKGSYSELFEDLIVTGRHSILINKFINEKQKKDNDNLFGFTTPLVDGKHCLFSCNNPKATLYEKKGIFTIYHLALKSNNEYNKYGIFANGLLVESCDILNLKKLMNFS